jgi:hypothetical protein
VPVLELSYLLKYLHSRSIDISVRGSSIARWENQFVPRSSVFIELNFEIPLGKYVINISCPKDWDETARRG